MDFKFFQNILGDITNIFSCMLSFQSDKPKQNGMWFEIHINEMTRDSKERFFFFDHTKCPQ